MSKALITESILTNIANAIRTKLGIPIQMKPGDMPAAIMQIGGEPALQTLVVSSNGEYEPDTGYIGFDSVDVDVPNTYTAEDEGKVVSSGELIAQTARASAITVNGTYDTTNNNSVTVNVQSSDSIATNGLQIYYDGKNNTGNGHDGTVSQWTDLSGNNNHGTIVNGTWSTDELQFNGSSSCVKCGEHNPTVLTVEAIVCWNSSSNSTYGDEVCSNLEAGGCSLYLKNKVLSFIANINGTYNTVDLIQFETGRYYHVVGIVDTSSIKICVNGFAKAMAISGTLTPPSRNTELMLGTNPQGSAGAGDWLNGKIKAFRLYNRVLSYSEIMSNLKHDFNYYGLE